MKVNLSVGACTIILLALMRTALAQSPPFQPLTSSSAAAHSVPSASPPLGPAGDPAYDVAVAACKAGDQYADKGMWVKAAVEYARAGSDCPEQHDWLYGLARCAAATGQIKSEIGDYRAAIYNGPDSESYGEPGVQYAESDVRRLSEYILLLAGNKQADEALDVYNHTVDVIRQTGGEVSLYELPPPSVSQDGSDWTKQIEGNTHVFLAVGAEINSKAEWSEFASAYRLQPNSVFVNFHFGRALMATNRDGGRARLETALANDDGTYKGVITKFIDLARR
jgi:hypothetical protein